MQDWINTVIYGIVEGITEFLPISSTGHLILTENILHDARSDFFLVGIQAGAILAIVLIYWSKLWNLVRNWQIQENRNYLLKLAVSFLVTAVLAVLVVDKFHLKLTESPLPVAWALVIGGVLIFVSEYFLRHHSPSSTVLWRTAVIIGVAQVVAAIFPGTSRSAATIIAAMFCGMTRVSATEFSFLLSIPTMFAATGHEFLKLYKNKELNIHELDQFALGFVVSAVVAFIAVKWLLGYIQTHSFISFAWYRLVLGLGLLAWLTFAR